MLLKESCNIFDIKNIDNIDKKSLKKKYHKLCLLYHPDKSNKNPQLFLKITDAYHYLNEYIDKKQKPKSNENIYDDLLELFSIENIKSVINAFTSYKKSTSYSPVIININTSIKQLFNKSVFILHKNCYIPLWYNYICEVNIIRQKYFIYNIIITDLPKNVIIKNNNDIVILVNNPIKYQSLNYAYITNEIYFTFYVNNTFSYNTPLCLKNKGIPKKNMNNIFDCSKISDVYIVCSNKKY
uniref:J domain-containing protein n=1 Tax=Florenciella sp. virus SA2 TaxID=3240092 RepID=A0AB39JBD2_9VIRU